MTDPLWYSAAGLAIFALIGWVWQVISRNGGYADVVWVFGLGATGLYYLIGGDSPLYAKVAAVALLLVWSGRLGGHILLRVAGEPEDGRYQSMRERFGHRINIFHLFFFMTQALLAWLLALPHWVIGQAENGLHPVAVAFGFAIGVTGLVGEAIADRQLSRWRSRPENRGRTCRTGLWRYSRHPNYFFEWIYWFAWPVMALGAPGGLWVWLAPVVMLLFLRFLTGVPYTEKQALKSRGEDYRHYQRSTSAFIPWRPRHVD